APRPRAPPAPARSPRPARSDRSQSRLPSLAQRAKSRPERLPALEHRLEEVAVLLDPVECLAPPEVPRPHLLAELLPLQRRRHGRARFRPHRVGRRNRLAVAVLAVVDEHAAALLLEPLGRHETGVLLFELARHTLGEL